MTQRVKSPQAYVSPSRFVVRWEKLKQTLPLLGQLQLFFEAHPLIIILPIFTCASRMVFTKFYETSVEVIDEEFHLHQARDYCFLHFDRWHPKITTPPGLYYLAAILCSPFDHCETYCFRHVSFIASIANLVLFFKILQFRCKTSTLKNVISSINISLLPPLYFFNHLYYSDVPSLTIILLMLYCYLKNQHSLVASFGVCSIYMRQTNVIWVIMIAGQYFLNYVMKPNERHTANLATHLEDFHHLSFRNLFIRIIKAPFIVWFNLFAYASVIMGFIVFVWQNGGIVLGDKSAHQAELHLPQLLYFSLFSILFGLPHFIEQIKVYFISFGLFNNRQSLLLILIILIIIHFNTLEHPYLLADNRHYIFYIWNRYLKYYTVRMSMAFVYHFGIFGLINSFFDKTNVWSFFTFMPCLILVLCFQKLIEVRYFIVPFVLWRLQLRNVKIRQLFFEFLLYTFINIVTIRIFFYKEIKWDDRSSVQRMIW